MQFLEEGKKIIFYVFALLTRSQQYCSLLSLSTIFAPLLNKSPKKSVTGYFWLVLLLDIRPPRKKDGLQHKVLLSFHKQYPKAFKYLQNLAHHAGQHLSCSTKDMFQQLSDECAHAQPIDQPEEKCLSHQCRRGTPQHLWKSPSARHPSIINQHNPLREQAKKREKIIFKTHTFLFLMHFEINLKVSCSALSHSFWHMAQSKFSSCKSQPGMTFTNTVQDQLILQGLTGYRSSPAEVSSAFHFCRDNFVSLLFILSSEELGYSRDFSEN